MAAGTGAAKGRVTHQKEGRPSSLPGSTAFRWLIGPASPPAGWVGDGGCSPVDNQPLKRRNQVITATNMAQATISNGTVITWA